MITCPTCGSRLNPEEVKRLESGIDIACSICGGEIQGEIIPEKIPTSDELATHESDNPVDKAVAKIKEGVNKFVDWIEEKFGDNKTVEKKGDY
jgi:hypothetical protein